MDIYIFKYIYMKQPLVVVAVVLALLTVLVLLPVHCTVGGYLVGAGTADTRYRHILYT